MMKRGGFSASRTIRSIRSLSSANSDEQDLEERTIERRILRQIHLAHSAFADWRRYSIA